MSNRIPILLATLCFIVLAGMLSVLLVLFSHLREETRLRLNELETRLEIHTENILTDTAKLVGDHGNDISMILLSLGEETQNGFTKQNRSITALQNSVRIQTSETKQVEKTFSTILVEQQKQHIDTVALDASLQQKFDQAKKLFDEKDFHQAYAIFSEVSSYQKDNYDAYFFAAYALFLKNTMDTASYTRILADFDFLEKNGYRRPEMNEIRTFIQTERAVLDGQKTGVSR